MLKWTCCWIVLCPHPRHKGVVMLNLFILTRVLRMIMRASKMMFCQSVLMANFQTLMRILFRMMKITMRQIRTCQNQQRNVCMIFSVMMQLSRKLLKSQELQLINPRKRFLRLVTEQENQIFCQLFQKTILIFFLWMKKLKNIWKFHLWIL